MLFSLEFLSTLVSSIAGDVSSIIPNGAQVEYELSTCMPIV